MPKYDYKCDNCGTTVEYYREFGEDHMPSCCNHTMSRVWTATGTIFKGSGWGGQ